MSPRKDHFRIPFTTLKIDKRSDFLSLSALMVSLVTALFSVFFYVTGVVKGADVVLFKPPQITLLFEDIRTHEKVFRIGARMAYVNRGNVGYNAAISKEVVSFTLGDTTFEQTWQSFESFRNVGIAIQHDYLSDAHPEPILSGSSISHETFFAPHPVFCDSPDSPDATCDKWINFIQKKNVVPFLNPGDSIEFVFETYLYGVKKPIKAICRIVLDGDIIGNLLGIDGAAPSCR